MSLRSLSRIFLAVLLVASCTLFAVTALADSQVRIVRLSDVHGSVQIDKNSGLGFENAFLNLPITQGTQLRTLDTGRAEVEFEDGSTLRVGPKTTVRFDALGRDDAGARLTAVNLVEGMAYVNWFGKRGESLTLNFSREKVSLAQAAHIRLEASAESANLAVFKGDIEVEGPTASIKVPKGKTAMFDVGDDDKSALDKHIKGAPLDSWDKESIAYHDQYAKNANSSPYGYGQSDLNYYGSYSNVPGYGMMWQPYFAGVGWDPFMDGAWGWYPGYGYMYASAYPWGWLPYRYGNWMFVPSFGWMWQPGAWNSWVTVPRYTPTSAVHVTRLVPPTTGTVRTVFVGKSGTVSTSVPSRIFIKNGSAGLGIARGSITDLHHLNSQVSRNGYAEVYHAPLTSASAGYGAMSSHRTMAGAPVGHVSSGGHASASGGGHR